MSPSELEKPIRRHVQGGRGCSPGHPFAPHGIEHEKDTRTFARSGISEGRGDLDGELHGVGLHDPSVPRGACGGDPADRARGRQHFGSGRRAESERTQ